MLGFCTYIGLAAEQLANLHRYAGSYVSVVVLSSLSPLATALEVAVFPVFRPMVPLLLWYSRRSCALAEHCINIRRL